MTTYLRKSVLATVAAATLALPVLPATASAAAAHGHHHPTNMHSTHAPTGARTWGRADVDGDGIRDTVIVSTKGWVKVKYGDSDVIETHKISPANPGRRLQGLPDLDGDGAHEILVSETASGCCEGSYAFLDTRSTVLRYVNGHLVTLHNGRHQFGAFFDSGRGDVWAGIDCGDATFVQREALGFRHHYKLTKTTFKIDGRHVVRLKTVITHHRHGPTTVERAGSTSCGGLTGDGWASGLHQA